MTFKPFKLVTSALALCALPVHAQDNVPQAAPKLPFANCTQGQGCSCALSAVNLGEAAVLLGVAVPPGPYDAYVILRDGQSLTFETASMNDLHTRYGGTGACEINLFPSNAADTKDEAGLVPRDGLWQASTVGAQFDQCNPTIETMVRGSGVLNSVGASKHIAWNQTFDPAKIEFGNTDGQLMTWTQVDPMTYEGLLAEVTTCQGCAPFTVEMTLEITSPTTITGQSTMDMAALFPDDETRAAMASLGMGSCKVTTDFAITHISD